MEVYKSLCNRILTVSEKTFESLALEVFNYQKSNCDLYTQWLSYLPPTFDNVNKVEQIPCMPINFFKAHEIKAGNWSTQRMFRSSGTSEIGRSAHHLRDVDWYHQIAERIFKEQMGDLQDRIIIALLPNYLENEQSSLVDMVDFFIKQTGHEQSGFYLDQVKELSGMLKKLKIIAKESKKKVLLWGVSFALLDLCEIIIEEAGLQTIFSDANEWLEVMETGGMKGKRRELTREELHDQISRGFQIDKVSSEYGMTELLSQSYAPKEGIFQMSASMKILLRDVHDPFDTRNKRRYGGINVIDLANIDTCAFIATDDLGRYGNLPNTFEVLGRLDAAQVRGCNLLI